MEEWVFIGDEHTDEQAPVDDPVFQSTDYSDCIPGATMISKQCDPVPCESTIPRDQLHFWERLKAPLLPLRSRPKRDFIHPQQLSPFPERLELPFSSDDILSGYEDLVSSGSGHFTMWGKMSPHEVLAEHVVDIHKVVADFRDVLKENSLPQTYGVNKYFSSQSPVQRRLSIYNWNPGPRRGREYAFEKQIAVKWHIVSLQETSDYVDHDILHERFHVTHYAGCAILFNKDTFYPDINVKSIYLHDTRRGLPDQIIEGELQGVLSRASFRRAAVSGQKFFTVLSLHISNIYAKKKGIANKLIQTLRAIMISQEVDLVAGDFNGTAWRCRSRNNLSTIDEAFSDCTPPGPTPLWGPGSIPNHWEDVSGFLKPPGSQRFWRLIEHGAFSIPRKALGLRPTDQSCHHETWLHLDFVDWSNKCSNQTYYNGHIRLKERPADSSYGTQKKRNISEAMSDHSLSS